METLRIQSEGMIFRVKTQSARSHAAASNSILTTDCRYDNHGGMNSDPSPAALLPLIVADVYELAGRFRARGRGHRRDGRADAGALAGDERRL